jgi:hypothetical protein
LKGNQSTFHQDVIAWFESVDLDQCCRDASVFLETKEKNHGRLETRRYYYFTDHSLGHYAEQWKGFRGIGMVESIRDDGKKVTTDRRYFIASLSVGCSIWPCDVKRLYGN